MVSLASLQDPSGNKDLQEYGRTITHRQQTIQQTMERLPLGTRRLAAQLRTSVPSNLIWNVLTDYEHLSDFIPNLSSSKVLERFESGVHLSQIGTQKFIGFNFSAQVQLELIEDLPRGVLSFHLLRGDFRKFEGSWTIRKLNNELGTCLIYELTVQGCLGMPVGLIERRLREDLSSNLLAVEKEAFSRQENLARLINS